MIIKGQNIVSPYGSTGNVSPGFAFATLENNPAIGNSIKDWELSFIVSSAYNNSEFSSYIRKISLGKRLGNHSLYFRYMPEMKKEFIIDPGINVNLGEDDTYSLKKYQTYKEDIGFSYGYTFDKYINIGFSFRHMKNKYSEEVLNKVFNPDSSTYFFLPELLTKETDLWIGDLGLGFNISPSVKFNLYSKNLFSNFSDANYSPYKMEFKKEVILNSIISPLNNFNFKGSVSSNNSYSLGCNYVLNNSIGNFILGIDYFYKNSQNTITGIIPSLTYFNEFFSITFSGLKYINKNRDKTITDFENEGIDDFYINEYDYDKAFVSINMALSFKKKKSVKLLDVEVINPIYPTLEEEYLFRPFAKGTIVNLTNKKLNIRTATKIENINKEKVLSNQYKLLPKDTTEVDFFITVEGDKTYKKHKISEAEFYILVNNEPDDFLNKPVLINSSNSWNGKIENLKYFMKKDLKYTSEFAKSILTSNKSKIESENPYLEVINKIKIIYNNVASQFLYVSDPRAATEYVQFPSETLKLKGGDCDDLSVCFASLFEGIGIKTAFIDYQNDESISHVSLLIDTGIEAENASIITKNDKKVFIRKSGNKNTVWLPLETTVLTGFNDAWNVGSEKFFNEAILNMGLAKKKVRIIDFR